MESVEFGLVYNNYDKLVDLLRTQGSNPKVADKILRIKVSSSLMELIDKTKSAAFKRVVDKPYDYITQKGLMIKFIIRNYQEVIRIVDINNISGEPIAILTSDLEYMNFFQNPEADKLLANKTYVVIRVLQPVK